MKQNKILLYGLPASGKSHALASILKIPEARLIYLVTERNAISGFENGLKTFGVTPKPGQVIIAVIETKSAKVFEHEFAALEKFVQQTHVQAQQSDDRTNMNKDKYTFFLDVVGKFKGFTGYDYVTKEEVKLGNIGQLGENDILAVDGLTPITHGIWNIIKGDRVISQLQDYGTVQYWLKQMTFPLINIKASVILLAHADLITDDIEKKEKIRVALNAGYALAGSYGGNWGNVIYAYQNPAGKRVWAGKKLNVETAARDFPEEDNLVPDFSLYNFF